MHAQLPGTRSLAFARRWFAPQTIALVFDPLVADWQREWIDAAHRERWRISLRWVAAFVLNAMVAAPRAVLLAPMPRSMTRRVLSRIIIFTGVASALLSLPFLWDWRALSGQEKFWRMALSLLPAGAALAFPFAMTSVIDAIRRRPHVSHVERAAVLRIGLIAVVFSTLLLGWGVPAANQAFRNIAAPAHPRPPARGVRELTIGELLADPDRMTRDAQFTRFGRRGAIRRELNNRAAFAVLPAVLLWVRWGARGRPRQRWYSPLPAAIATATTMVVFFSLYLASVVIEPNLNLNPGTGLWVPIIALLLWGAAERRWSRRWSGRAA